MQKFEILKTYDFQIFFARIPTLIAVMLVPTTKLIVNSESASKSGLEKPQDEVSQPQTDRSRAGEECDATPRTAITFQS